MPSVLTLYQRCAAWPLGKWLFSRLVCLKAPYFASIAPRIVELAPGRGVARLAHRRAVSNHLGTVHAIALCNLAEFIGGLATEASLPADLRWIPRGMQVEYQKKAVGVMHAEALLDALPDAGAVLAAGGAMVMPVQVTVRNAAGEAVMRASIDMWISTRRR